MAEVKVIARGYASNKDTKATSNCSLIVGGENKIIVDPGMDRPKLLEGLAKENLKPSDINYVIISHTHLDHCGLAGIFENATLVDDGALYTFDGGYKEYDNSPKISPSDDIEIIKTPGHDPFHCSVLVKTDKGIVAIAQDVFWWWDEEEQKTDRESLLNHKDEYAKDEKQLKESREKILKLANWIIPGHGEMFENESL